jgi:hypothetical protein
VIERDRGVSRGRVRRVALAVSVCALITSAALPALASAAEFAVNSVEDTVETTACETSSTSDECTLRSAIDLANTTPNVGGPDTITFSQSVFGGAAPASTIEIGSPLPAVTESVTLLGGDTAGRQCPTGWGLDGPCVEIIATGVTGILPVKAGNVTVEGIAFGGAQTGILVEKGATRFTARNDWFGVGLNSGVGAGLSKAGIRLDAGADEALIGGLDPTERNVFTTGEVGLYVDGASSSATQGNYFGLQPNGAFSFGHSLDVGVRIVDDTSGTPVVKAGENEVGGVLGPEATTAACDGPCNAFAVEEGGADIDLGGFSGGQVAAASGPTRIRGNYLGLSPDGTAGIGRAEEGIYAGPPRSASEPGPSEVIVGGSNSLSEGNFFVGGRHGVLAERAELLGVIGNEFGYLFEGSRADAPEVAGISASSEGVAVGAYLVGNKMNAEGSIGIESLFKGAQISGNEIVGGQFGILAKNDDGGVGNLIEGNILTEAGGAESGAGIKVENDANLITGNSVSKAKGVGIYVDGEDFEHQSESNTIVGNEVTEAAEIGVAVGSNANHNRVGGDAAGEANTLLGSGFAVATPEWARAFGAITINSRQAGRNEIAANTGFGNAGAFIKLISHGGMEEPNGGIKPPVIATARQSSATGTALPGATVRVFSKAKSEAGELGALLGVVTADAGGAWKATFAKQPVGTLLAATQTGEIAPVVGRGTSEVSAPLAAIADPEDKGGGGGGGGDGGGGGGSTGSGAAGPPPPPAVAKVALKVKIVFAPEKTIEVTTVKFKFAVTNVSAAMFECKLDGAKWAKCVSQKIYRKLKVGKHTFRVRAVAAGLTGPVTKYRFTVKG